jgi:type VI secretion system secreted protein VgrG
MATRKTEVTARLESTAFACDALTVVQVRGREAISEPFVYDVEIESHGDAGFDPKAALAAEVALVFELDGAEVRRVHGIVGEVTGGLDALLQSTHHALRIVPRLHRLTLSAACEVFLDRSVLDIARDLLGRASLREDDLHVRLVQAPAAREFCLQYAESNLAFLSRHLERAGIAYSFDHAQGKDVLVLSDDNDAFRPAVGPEAILFIGREDERGIKALRARSQMMTARHVVHDYDADHPRLDLRTDHVLDVPFGGEVVDFCAGHSTPVEGRRLAKIRAEAHQAARDGFEGESNVPYVEAARTIAVDGLAHAPPGRLLVVWVEHHLVLVDGVLQGAGRVWRYENRFRAVLASRHWSPAFATPWPRIAGFVHAVTDAPPPGDAGRIAQLDAGGRYTVRFLFDKAAGRAGSLSSSARVRMMQPHAGPGYGMHFPLKPGVEVLVAFIEGDPDRPVIAGSVPNPLTASPVTQANAQMNRIATESGIKITMKDA